MSRIITQRLDAIDGGLDVEMDPLQMERVERAPLPSPDCLNAFGGGGVMQSRLGCAPWIDGGTNPLRWFSFFVPQNLAAAGIVTQSSGGFATPTVNYPAPAVRRRKRRTPDFLPFLITAPLDGITGVDPAENLTITWDMPLANQGVVANVSGIWATQLAAGSSLATVPGGTLDYATWFDVWVFGLFAGPDGLTYMEGAANPVSFRTKVEES
jgi:hypothetical protein